MSRTLYDIAIQNVVASVTMEQTFNLVDIHKIVPNSEYNPKKFPGLCYRTKRPKSATLIFKTGKMVCTGTKSKKQAISTVNKVVKELKEYGIIISSKPVVTVQNIVSSANLGKKIDVETAADLMENIMYEPEQFPGAVYRMNDPKTVLLLFSTGKIVITGAKKEKQVFEAVKKIRAILSEYDVLF